MPDLSLLQEKTQNLKKELNGILEKFNGSKITVYSMKDFENQDHLTQNIIQAVWNIIDALEEIAKTGEITNTLAYNGYKYSKERAKGKIVDSLKEDFYVDALTCNLDYLGFRTCDNLESNTWSPPVFNIETVKISIAYLVFLNFLEQDKGSQELLSYKLPLLGDVLESTRIKLNTRTPNSIMTNLKQYFKNQNKKSADILPLFPKELQNEKLIKFFSDLDETNWDVKRAKAKKQLEKMEQLELPTALTPEELQSISPQLELERFENAANERKEFLNKALAFLKAIDTAITEQNTTCLTEIMKEYPEDADLGNLLRDYLEFDQKDTRAQAFINELKHTIDTESFSETFTAYYNKITNLLGRVNQTTIENKITTLSEENEIDIKQPASSFNISTYSPYAQGLYQLQKEYQAKLQAHEKEKSLFLKLKQSQATLEKKRARAEFYKTELEYAIERISAHIKKSSALQVTIDKQLNALESENIPQKKYNLLLDTIILIDEENEDHLKNIEALTQQIKEYNAEISSLTQESSDRGTSHIVKQVSKTMSNPLQENKNTINTIVEEFPDLREPIKTLDAQQNEFQQLLKQQSIFIDEKYIKIFNICGLFLKENQHLNELPNKMDLLNSTLTLLKLIRSTKSNYSSTILADYKPYISKIESRLIQIKTQLKNQVTPAFSEAEELYLEYRNQLSQTIIKEKNNLKQLEKVGFKSTKEEDQYHARKKAISLAEKVLIAFDEKLPLTADNLRIKNSTLPEVQNQLKDFAEILSRTVLGLKFVIRNGEAYRATLYCAQSNSETFISYNIEAHKTNLLTLLTEGKNLKRSEVRCLRHIGLIMISFAVGLLFIAGILALIPSGGTSLLAFGLMGLRAVSLGGLGAACLYASSDSNLETAVKDMQMLSKFEENAPAETEQSTMGGVLSNINRWFQPVKTGEIPVKECGLQKTI